MSSIIFEFLNPPPIFQYFFHRPNSIREKENRQCRSFPGVERFIIGLIKESVSLAIRFVIKDSMEFLSGVGPFVPRNNGDWLLVDRSSKVKELEKDEEERKRNRRRRRRGWLLLVGARLQRSAEFFSRIRGKFLPGARVELDDTGECSSKARRMNDWNATTPLEESCSMTLHLDRLRPLGDPWGCGLCVGLDVACSNPFRWIVDTGVCGIVCVRYGHYGL